ncbi:hypothetical protein AAFF_G00017930 [Aldrovandia affinis]|uniref:Uncharacterized protein n=1 Tax=Aldrovandia affinis TaxID=143900 RepID=A0AAD7S672_9TELE|nr:hypothetical protein AAFF_G00017930 [Aldrovandia affinis]
MPLELSQAYLIRGHPSTVPQALCEKMAVPSSLLPRRCCLPPLGSIAMMLGEARGIRYGVPRTAPAKLAAPGPVSLPAKKPPNAVE